MSYEVPRHETFTEEHYLAICKKINWDDFPGVETLILWVEAKEENTLLRAFVFNPKYDIDFKAYLTVDEFKFFTRTFDWTPFEGYDSLDIPMHEDTGYCTIFFENPNIKGSIPDQSPDRFLENCDMYLKDFKKVNDSLIRGEIPEEDMEQQLATAGMYMDCCITQLQYFVTTVNPYYVRRD